MEGQSPVCTACNSLSATMFCMCEADAILLCTNCFPTHFTKNPGRIHHPYPIQAFALRSIPGYFERLEKRSSAVPAACQELKRNLQSIDQCAVELSSKADRIIASIQEYVRAETEKLQRVKTQLQSEIEEAVAEVERTLYEDEPALRSKFGPMLRSCGSDLSQLTLFKYEVHDIGDNLRAIIELIDTSGGASQAQILPQIHGNSLQCLDLISGRSTSATLSVSFSNSTVFCLLDAETVLAAGGKPSSTAAYAISTENGTVVQLQSMHVARRLAGILKHGAWVYVFGGSDGSKQLSACEKLAVTERTWTALPDMTHPRGGFSPCLFGPDIYLPDVKRDHRVMETFNVAREEFKTLSVSIPASLSSNSVAFILEGEMVIITVDKQMGKWRIGGDSGFRVSKIAMKDVASGMSNLPPTRKGREMLWVRWKDGAVVRFNIDTDALLE